MQRSFVYVRTTSTRHFVGDLKPFWHINYICTNLCLCYIMWFLNVLYFVFFVVSSSVNKQSSWQPVLSSGLRHHTHDRIELEGLLWIIHPYLLHVIQHALVEGDVCCLIRHKVVDGARWPLVSTKVAETHYVVNIACDEREIAFDSAAAFVLLMLLFYFKISHIDTAMDVLFIKWLTLKAEIIIITNIIHLSKKNQSKSYVYVWR